MDLIILDKGVFNTARYEHEGKMKIADADTILKDLEADTGI